MKLNIHDICRLSGLSRVQVEQAISRWLITPHHKSAPGQARRFTQGDAFAFCLAGELHRIGFSWPAIRDVYAVLPFPEVDEYFEQVEIFPGYAQLREAVAVVTNFNTAELPVVRYVERADLSKVGAEPAIVLPATRIAKLVEAVANE